MMSNQTPDWWVDAVAKTAYGIRAHLRQTTPNADPWQLPGIKTAVAKVAELVPPDDVAVVTARAAANPKLKTPGGITAPGPQWAGTQKATQPPPKRCPTHNAVLHAGDCPECAKKAASTRPDDWRGQYQQALRDAREQRERDHQEAMNHE